MIRVTIRKVIVGLGLLGLSGTILAVSALFLSQAISIIDYGGEDIYPAIIGCEGCQSHRETLLLNSLIFGIIGGTKGLFGAWFLVTGHKRIEKAGMTKR